MTTARSPITDRRRVTRHVLKLWSVLILLALLLSTTPTRAAGPLAPPAPGIVGAQVWRDLAASSDHRATFTIILHEPLAGDPASAISAQINLEGVLATLQRLGSVSTYTAYYGVNATVVTGGRAALRLLANWPSVAAIRAYDPGQPWETAKGRPAAGEATGQITGVVTGPDGTTLLSGIKVTAYRQTGPVSWTIGGTATTSGSGVYSIGSLATGIYRARFESLTGAFVTEFYDNKSDFSLATNISVTDGQTTANIDASLAQAGSIAGRVTDIASGSGAFDVVVTAWIDEGGVWRQAGSTLTADDGTYTLAGLTGGLAYRVKFSDGLNLSRYLDEYYDNVTTIGAATPVNVTAGQTTANIHAALGSYGKLSGTVTGPNGVTAAANIKVDVYQFNTTLGQWEWVSGDTTTTSGAYQATGLETRNYRVYFSDPTLFFVPEYYNNKPDLLTADDVPVQLGLTTAGINASLGVPCYFADVQPDANHSIPSLCDNDVDIADVERVAGCWLQPVGPACPATLDFDDSGTINALDLVTVAGEWGWRRLTRQAGKPVEITITPLPSVD